jgi:UDPglucose 6-dehydrogenase
MYKVGIIGNGFVGSSIASGFGLHSEIRIFDQDPAKSSHSFEEVLESEFVFVSVPTPMDVGNGNRIDLSIVRNVFEKISNHISKISPSSVETVVILKSTVIPGTTAKLSSEFPDLEIVFNPEFLTERNARLDFINSSRIVLGGSSEACDRVAGLYRERFPYTSIISTDTRSAEFIKYMCNCFFSTKISFMNEMKQCANHLGLDWDKVMSGFMKDGRIGNSHIEVPGHDGSLGFGGKCFPKDLNAFINFFEELGIDPLVMRATWQKNLEVRRNKDWESIPGATSTKLNLKTTKG